MNVLILEKNYIRGSVIMKNSNKFLVIISILLSMFFLTFKIYALDNSMSKIDNLSTDATLKIEKFIQENMNKGSIPGLSVTIVNGDKTVYKKGFGYSDIAAQKPINSKTLFEIGSNSKAFTALGILALQKNGLIKLDDEVTKHIPWLKVKYKGNEAKITLEQLLHHTSGIPFKTIDKIPVSSDENGLENTVKTLVNIELDSSPGEKFQYATINYDVLGLVIRNVTGISYEKYIEENILKPMGLNNTYLYKNIIVDEQLAKGYKIGFLKPQVYEAPVYIGNKPAGYIISNGKDMAKWLKIQIDTLDDSKFDKSIIKESHEPNRRIAPLDDGTSYACGWFVYQKGEGEISHSGNNPNYSSFIDVRPGDKVGIAILSNTNSEYVSVIGQGINEILQGKDYNKDIKDLNTSADSISILIICITSLLAISTLYFMFKGLIQISKKDWKLNKKDINGKSIFKISFSLVFMLGLSYSIYLIPYILYNGVSWEFVFVWLPKSVKYALYLVYLSIWSIYIYYAIESFCKKR